MKRTKNTPTDIYGWLDRVFRHLRFGGDEAALRQELTDHFEDRLNFLQEQGCPAEEAQQKALAAMGDPDETGRLLRKVCQPWLGLLLWTVRGVLIALAVALICQLPHLLPRLESKREQSRIREAWIQGEALEEGLTEDTIAAVRAGRCSGEGRLGSYRVEPVAAWTCWGRFEEPLDRYREGSWVVLKIASPPWEEPDPRLLQNHLTLWDDKGRRYRDYELYCREADDLAEDLDNYYTLPQGRDLTACYYTLWLNGASDPERLELDYDDGANRFQCQVVFGARELWKRPAPPSLGTDPQAEEQTAARFPGLEPEQERLISSVPGRAEPSRSEGMQAELLRAAELELVRTSDGAVFRRLQLLLKLSGAWQDLPLNFRDLRGGLQIIDSTGRDYALPEEAGDRLRLIPLEEPAIYEDAGLYWLELSVEEPGDWYELYYERAGRSFCLRIVMGEEEQP